MNLWQALVLGIIEGITEFLPISSTGHMVLAAPLLGIDEQNADWRVFLFASQLGAIIAVVVLYWTELWRKTIHRPADLRQYLWTKLAVALAPGIVGGILLGKFQERLEDNSVAVAGALIVGALVMAWIDRRYRRETPQTIDDITLRQAVLIGAAQILSMWPGVSRSGATIFTGMVLGLTPAVAAEFSFLLAIPTMFAAASWRLIRHGEELHSHNGAVILLGATVAFAVALLVVAGFVKFVQKRRFTPFVVYRIILGLAVILYYSLGSWRVAPTGS